MISLINNAIMSTRLEYFSIDTRVLEYHSIRVITCEIPQFADISLGRERWLECQWERDWSFADNTVGILVE